MNNRLVSETLSAYPELAGALPADQWEIIERMYHTPSDPMAELDHWLERKRWMDDHIVTRPFGTQEVRVFEDRPTESSNRVVVALGEFGNGIAMPALLRADVVRTAVAPDATLLLIPNDTHTETDNLGLTRAERKKLLDKDPTPFVERLQKLTEDFDEVAVLGPSQGATIGAAYGAHKNSPEIALAAIEPANVVRRPNRLVLARDFMGSAGHLTDNININAPDEDSVYVREHVESIDALGNLTYGLGIIRPSNLAIAALMNSNTFKYDVDRILARRGSVAHVWSVASRVSPDIENLKIAARYYGNPRYDSMRLRGETADHSSTNVAAICVAAMSRAINLRS